jgi:hypothetical protein
MIFRNDSVGGRARAVLAKNPSGLTAGEVAARTGDDIHSVRSALTHMKSCGVVGHAGRWGGTWTLIQDVDAESALPPVTRPCLVCGMPHRSTHKGDRLHVTCRTRAAQADHQYAL